MTESETTALAGEHRSHVVLEGIAKHYGGVRALAHVNLAVEHATVHALIGENGAGKSTLGRIICGAVSPDRGAISLHGQQVELTSPRHALRHGIALVSQEPTLVPQLTVLENVFLGRNSGRLGLLRSQRDLRDAFETLTAQAGFDLLPSAHVRDLSMAQKQRVTVLRALARGAQLIVMDEPTSTLTSNEAEQLLALVRRLRDSGRTIVYISHSLPEVLAIADTITVLRDGNVIHTRPAATETQRSLASAMLGREFSRAVPPPEPAPADAHVVLEVRGLTGNSGFRDVSLSVRAGEIVGLAGLVGSGRSETIRAILGAEPADSGTVELAGKRVRFRSPKRAWAAGIAYIPESRTTQGLLLNRSLTENVTLPHLSRKRRLWLSGRRSERRQVEQLLADLDVRTSGAGAKARTLSGGNQQKVLLARCLFRTPKLLIADEPTRGVDIGARAAIYQILARLASEGLAVLVVSSETEEVRALAHRILVMRAGRIVAEFDRESATEQRILDAALGVGAAA